MPHTLLLDLVGPMQSWGHRSRFDNRDTGLEPTRSGVVGLLCAALGWERDVDLSPFEPLRMGVRVEKPGRVALDYHTATDRDQNTTVSNRYYLADARFLVGLEGEPEWLQTLSDALKNPRWPLFLGRKAFPCSLPLTRGIEVSDLETSLRGAPWKALTRYEAQRSGQMAPLKLILETQDPSAGETIVDAPISFERRRYGVRYLTFSNVQSPTVTMWNEGVQL